MTTLILPPRFNEDTNRVRKAASSEDWTVERLTSWRVPEHLSGPDLVLYGEPLFAAVVGDALGLSLIEPSFEWLTQIPAEYLKREIRFMFLEEARRISERRFFKPADDKCFVANVYESGRELPSVEILPPRTPVLVATPLIWEVEFRCFVLDRNLAAISVYSRLGELAQNSAGEWVETEEELLAATEFVERILNDDRIAIPPATVIDIGVIEGAGWAIVESNPAWGSGIYGCDAFQVLPVLKRCSVSHDQVTDEDRLWLPVR